jgi:hypothetical protein
MTMSAPGNPENIYSLRVLPPVTRSGHGQAVEFGKNVHLDLSNGYSDGRPTREMPPEEW